jgi:hypothetical protein
LYTLYTILILYAHLIEDEAYKLNQVLLLNHNAHLDILVLIKKTHIEAQIESEYHYEHFITQWRLLQHNRAIETFHTLITSERFTAPTDRTVLFQQFTVQQQNNEQNRQKLIFDLISHRISSLSTIQVNKTHFALNDITDIETANAQSLCHSLRHVNESVLLDIKTCIEDFRYHHHT